MTDINYDSMTKEQLKQILDERSIVYKATDTKAQLVERLVE